MTSAARRPTVAVVVPLHVPEPDEHGRISLRHLRTHLGGYDTCVAAPEGLDVSAYGLPAKRFPSRFFLDRHAASSLMMRRELYAAFADYEYILVHHLDALVFSDQLLEWCERGYDYVGAPWVQKAENGAFSFLGVGNSGLCLRRVPSHLAVIDALRRPRRQVRSEMRFARNYVRRLGRNASAGLRAVRESHDLSGLPGKALRLFTRTARESNPYRYEDKFWAFEAAELCPGFRIPPAETAVSFSFEAYPRYCFELTGGKLPFGCHKWMRHDPEFWEPFLLR